MQLWVEMLRSRLEGPAVQPVPDEWPLSASAANWQSRRAPCKGGASPVGANPTRQSLQPEATGATMEVTKWLKPSVKRATTYGGSASVQAATRVNAEQASKSQMHRTTRKPWRGSLVRLDGLSEAVPPVAVPG